MDQYMSDQHLSRAADQLACVANAEKHLTEQAGPLVAKIIKEIEERYDLKIGQVRITINPSETDASWAGANCVITQADVVRKGD